MFLDDIGSTFTGIFNGVKTGATGLFDHVLKPIGTKAWDFGNKQLDRFDRIGNTADKVIDGAGNVAQGVGNLLSGNSNILVYIGIGLVAVLIVPKIIDKVL